MGAAKQSEGTERRHSQKAAQIKILLTVVSIIVLLFIAGVAYIFWVLKQHADEKNDERNLPN